jgi:hypothetical protein
MHIFHSVRAYAVLAPRSPVGRRSRSGWLCWWSVLPCWRRRGCTSWQMRSRVSGWARCEATRMRSTPSIQQRYLQDLDSFRSPDPYNGRRPRYPERLEWVVKREEQILVGNLGRRGLFRAKEGTHYVHWYRHHSRHRRDCPDCSCHSLALVVRIRSRAQLAPTPVLRGNSRSGVQISVRSVAAG